MAQNDGGGAAQVSVFASGLNNPRGLKFGPDHALYVAEGGKGGTQTTTEAECPQVPGAGPYSGDFNASIARVNRHGQVTRVVEGLPSSQTNPQIGSFVSGVADVAFIGHKLYAITAGAGCSHGLKNTFNAVIRVKGDGKWSVVANLSEFLMTHPVAHPEEEDFEPDGTWYSLLNIDGDLYAIEPNHGELDRITRNGKVSRVVDISASQGHIVPTAMTEVIDDVLLISNLRTFPVEPGSSSLFAATRGSFFVKLVSGFTTVLGLAARHGKVYVLEMSNAPGLPSPGKGDIVSIDLSGKRTTVVSGLDFPTAMTFGPDGNLYVSNKGFGFPPGAGEILKIKLH
jgi:hypothetical protein